MSSKSIWQWEEKYEDYGRIDPPSHLRGHPRVLNVAVMEDIHELIHEASSLFLDEIAEWLAIYHGKPISSTALHDNLRRVRLTYKKLRKVAAEHDNVYCAAWVYEISTNYMADQMVFLDKSSRDTHHLSSIWPCSLRRETRREAPP